MVSKRVKAILIIGVIASSILIVLVPLRQATLEGTRIVEYSGSVQQINLIADIEDISVIIDYAESPTADLFKLSYDCRYRSALISPSPTISVNFENSTSGSVLTVILSMDLSPSKLLSSLSFAEAYLTINPNLISNITVRTTSSDIELSTTNFSVKEFVHLNLTAISGNVDANLISGCNVSGDLILYTATGNNNLIVGANSYLSNSFNMTADSGSCTLALTNNVTLNAAFIIYALGGGITADIQNVSLNNNALFGQFSAFDGALDIEINQWSDPQGNLSLLTSTHYEDLDFRINLAEIYVSSEINASASIGGTVVIDPSNPGYHTTASGLASDSPDRASNIDVNLEVTFGDIRVNATRT